MLNNLEYNFHYHVAQLKVRCRISKMITDEVESTVEDPGQMKLL